MSKMVKCKTCGEEIAKGAKVCPKCGAKQKSHKMLGIVLAVLVVLVALVAIGSSGDDEGPKRTAGTGSPQTSDSAAPTSEPTDATPTPEPTDEMFNVGDSVDLNDIVVTLVDVSESTGKDYITPSEGKVFLVCEFEIENNSNKDINVSSMLSFEAYIDDYSTSMNFSAMSISDKAQLDGTVAAGRKMNGVIGYEADADWKALEIRFTPDFWSGKEIIFTHSK